MKRMKECVKCTRLLDMITFNNSASWCENFTDEYMGKRLDGDHYISTVLVPEARVPGAKMIFIDSFEPDRFSSPVEHIHKNIDLIDVLLTRRPELLKAYPEKAQKFVLGTTFLTKPRTTDKSKTISYSMTAKGGLPNEPNGYKLRWQFIKSAPSIKFGLPFLYFDSSRHPTIANSEAKKALDNPPYSLYPQILTEEKEPLFDSMFSIVIENQSLPNYFTEKLIDCLLSKTVPLYFGATNIEEYFDTEGMIIIKDINHLKQVVTNITADDYYKRLPIMQKNLELAQEFARPLCDRVIEAIKKAN